MLSLQSSNCYSTAVGKLPFAPTIMTQGLGFLRLCLETSAGVTTEQRLSNGTLTPLTRYLSEMEASVTGGGGGCVVKYLNLLQLALGPAGGGGVACGDCSLFHRSLSE